MTCSPRETLLRALAPEVVTALLELVDERVATATVEADAGSPWLEVAKAAEYLSVSARTIERRIAQKRLRSTTLGRRRLLHRDDLDAFAENGGRGGSSANHSTPPPEP